MPHRTGRLRWLLVAALTALLISVPALAIAQRETGRTAAAKKKKAASNRGPRGPRGPRGLRGLQGFSGKAGKDGVGATGPVGPKGDKGDTGDQKTKVFNVAMNKGEADRVVLHYPPFDVVARCRDDGGENTVTASLLVTTSTDDAYLVAPSGETLADFDVASGERRLLPSPTFSAGGPAMPNAPAGFTMASPAGAAISGQASIGQNVFAPPAGTPVTCLFTGQLSTT